MIQKLTAIEVNNIMQSQAAIESAMNLLANTEEVESQELDEAFEFLKDAHAAIEAAICRIEISIAGGTYDQEEIDN